MAQLDFDGLVEQVAADLAMDPTSGSEDETTIKRAVNWAGRRITASRDWPWRRAQTVISLVAPYTTGTATFTLDSAAVTGTGTTWTGFSARKMARAYNGPFYRISSVGGATSVTLARNFLEATATDSAYVIYQDEYDTASTVDVIESAYLLHNNTYGPMLAVAEDRIDAEATIQTRAGKPVMVGLTVPTTAGTPRIRVSPIPDAAYGIALKYQKGFTDLVNPTDTPVIPQNLEWLLVSVAELYAQRAPNLPIGQTEAQVEALIHRAWSDQQGHTLILHQRAGFDRSAHQPTTHWNVVG